jgi:hypothetical protein
MAAFWAVFTFGGSGPPITAHGPLDLKQEIQIQIQIKTSRLQNLNGFQIQKNSFCAFWK